MSSTINCSVLVVGSGNAGFCAAISAVQSGADDVLLIDKCPEEWAGGNSYFTAGAFRTVHGGLEDLLPIISNVDAETAEIIDLDAYREGDFLGDMNRMTAGLYDRELGGELVRGSRETIAWLAGNGLRFELAFNRQAFKVNGRFKFFGGLCLKTEDLGKGLIEHHQRTARSHGIRVLYSTAAIKINTHPQTGAFVSLLATQNGTQPLLITAKALVLAAGGFESNPKMRAQYLGPGWERAYVRGTPYNTGEVLEMAMRDVCARAAGQWSGCHSVAWDANAAQDTGDRGVSNQYTKSGYPLGVTVNVCGERFFDEGFDLRNYTYAKFGRAILGQPRSMAFQVWDGKGVAWLRAEEYRDERVEKIRGDTLEELARGCVERGLEDAEMFVTTIREYNEAVYAARLEHPELKWDPAIKDGFSTQSSDKGLKIPKSNWALPVDEGPFVAVKVGCGVTFTFGGLAIDPKTAGVIDDKGRVVEGVFCAGEMVGGLFHENYPGGEWLD